MFFLIKRDKRHILTLLNLQLSVAFAFIAILSDFTGIFIPVIMIVMSVILLVKGNNLNIKNFQHLFQKRNKTNGIYYDNIMTNHCTAKAKGQKEDFVVSVTKNNTVYNFHVVNGEIVQ
jgi:accessory colonization factor AcfC